MDRGLRAVGILSPVPGTGQALKTLKVADKVVMGLKDADHAAGAASLVARGAEGDKLLYRARNGPESATRLGNKAAEAEAAGFPHGVSVSSKPLDGRKCAVASCSEVKTQFKITKTGRDQNHYTVEIPKPVTKEVAEKFNSLFND